MKKPLSLILALAMLLSLSTAALAANTESGFSDVPTDWSHDAVAAAIENGLLQGYDGKVNPEGSLGRAEMAAIIVRALGGSVKADVSAFKDVASDKWYYDEMAIAVQMGILRGDGTKLKPEASVTREQAALILARAFRLTDADIDLSSFADADKLSDWALEGVAALVKAGYMRGDGTKLSPLDSISRKEFAQLMYNLVSDYVTEAGVVDKVGEGNVVIRAPGVTLKGVTIDGDVVIGEGVGDGDVTLKDSTINGRVIVRGGGASSIYISNSDVSGSVIAARRDGAVHISVEDGAQVGKLAVEYGSDKVVLSGEVKELSIGSPVDVVLNAASIGSISITADDVSLVVDKDTTVSSIAVAASGVEVDVAGMVTSVNVGKEAEGTAISGTGRVENVTAEPGSAETRVDTSGTTIVNNSENPITANGETIDAGTTGKTEPAAPGGGGSSPTTYYTLTMTIHDDLTDANPALTVSSTNNYITDNTGFYGEVVPLLEGKNTELKARFNGKTANALLRDGIAAYKSTDSSGWTPFTGKAIDGISEAQRALFNDKNVTVGQLRSGSPYTLSYAVTDEITGVVTTYTVTITIAAKA